MRKWGKERRERNEEMIYLRCDVIGGDGVSLMLIGCLPGFFMGIPEDTIKVDRFESYELRIAK